MNVEQRHPILQLALDVFIAFALFLLASLFAGFMHQTNTANHRWFYIVWLMIGSVPLLLYLQYRLGDKTNRWDILFFLPVPVLYILISSFVRTEYSAIVFVGLIFLARWTRDWFMNESIAP